MRWKQYVMSNENSHKLDLNKSDVALRRRISATILNQLFYIIIIVLLGIEKDLQILLITFVLYQFFNYWYLPHFTGYTISHWIMGYKIFENDQSNPSWVGLLKRNIIFGISNRISIGLIDVFTLLFRKDKKTLHDIVSAISPKRVTAELRFLRYFLALSIAVLGTLSLIKMSGDEFYDTFIYPQKVAMKTELNERNFLEVSLPLVQDTLSDYDTLTFPDSKFYILAQPITFSISDSNIIINNDTVNFRCERSVAHPMDAFNDSNIASQILSDIKLWNTEELIQSFYYDQKPSLLHPFEYYKKLYAGLIGAMIFPKFNDAVQSGFVKKNGHGHYAFVIKENGMKQIVFEIWRKNELNSLILWSKEASETDMRYLLENIGITSHN